MSTSVTGKPRESTTTPVDYRTDRRGRAHGDRDAPVLTVLCPAIGASALEPHGAGKELGIGAAIWGIPSTLIAFFLGGWVAPRTAAVAGAGSGMINGRMIGAAILALVLWLTGTGVSTILGTLTGLVLPLVAAVLGGLTGHNKQRDVMQSTSGRATSGLV